MIQIGNFVSKLYCLELLPLARFVCAVQEREGVDAFQPKTRADAENSTCLGGRRWDEYRRRNIRTYSSMSREVLSALRSFAHNRIDVHTHLIPPFYGEQLKSHGGDEVEKMATEQNQKRNTKATNKSPHGQSDKPSTQRMRRGEKEGVETQGPVSEQAANDKNKTSDFIAYPTNKVVGFIDDLGDAQAALSDLRASGFAADEIEVLVGEEGAQRIDVNGGEHGVLAIGTYGALNPKSTGWL
jgi:hypothetical protein